MLRTIGVDPLVTNLILVDEDSTINKIGNSKVIEVKVGTKVAKSESKNKNLVKLFWLSPNHLHKALDRIFLFPKQD